MRCVRRKVILLMVAAVVGLSTGFLPAEDKRADSPALYAKKNLVAWCVVPFDGKKRGPEARAAMLERLGIRKLAYDYRAKHIPTFDEEMRALKKHGIELTAWWFPTVLNAEAKNILAVLKRHNVKTQLWVMGRGEPKSPEEKANWVEREAGRIRPIAEAAAKIGCRVGLYNHGGWFGEPENQIAVIQRLKLPNVGIVYNLHHGHEHLDRFPKLLKQMRPYLYALNLNGMTRAGNQRGEKILPLGEGDLDLSLLRTIRDSGYDGPIGILNHTDHDAEARLQDNLDGLNWLTRQLDGTPAGTKPKYRTWQPRKPTAPKQDNFLEGRAEFRRPPITVECRATLRSRKNYNILVASDTKRSGAHWEIFSMPGSGHLTAYFPGRKPDHVRSTATICDHRPHVITMIYETTRVRLLVDGKQVADQAVKSLGRPTVPGELAIGGLVEGGLTCDGDIDWVRISKGVRKIPRDPPSNIQRDAKTIALWKASEPTQKHGARHSGMKPPVPAAAPPYSKQLVAELMSAAKKRGMPERGAAVFAAAKSACISCHKIGKHGGAVGPEMTSLGKERTPAQIIESLFWPKREVKPEFVSVSVLTVQGKVHRGYKVKSDKKTITLRDPTSGTVSEIARDDIEEEIISGTLMPDGLTAAMSRTQQLDLIAFLTGLGRDGSVSPASIDSLLAHAHSHVPATFPYDRKPLHPENWPSWKLPVNRDRLYDFYTKEAEYFRRQPHAPHLLQEFPGMDGGELGHWGNQNEQVWSNDRWNDTKLGSIQCGVFRGAGVTVARGVCVQLGDRGELSTCFNPDTLTYDAVWSGGFLKFSSVRHGFMHGLKLAGKALPRPTMTKPDKPFVYHGFYRHGPRVVFAYRIGDTEYLDAPWVEDGKFTRVVAPADQHPLKHLTAPGAPQWPQQLTTRITRGTGRPYAVDTIELPYKNPWQALLFCSGHDFLPDGNAMVCTMQGDVWHVSGLTDQPDKKGTPAKARWRRFASGLHHALGLVVADDSVYVLGRDQITRLQDRNSDGEADLYNCFSNAYQTSTAGHDFICGLQRDAAGNFYTASGNQGLLRISSDGKRAEVMATGFRNPDGLGLLPDGTLTVPCSEGDWTPASMICAVRPNSHKRAPHFGYKGPRDGQAPELPLVYLPRGLDNSSGEQTYINSDRWGPLKGQMLHLSFGPGAHSLVLRDEVDGQLQGGIVPLPGEFLSGVHRGRFNPRDGQLYLSGMAGWGTYTPDDGCFQRVRYTGDRVQLPTGFHVHENGVTVTFAQPIDRAIAEQPGSHFAQCWNYRYSGAYGSPEFSTGHPGVRGHDRMNIASAHVLPDGHTLFLELPDIQPVNQLHLRLHVESGDGHDLFLTVHKLDDPFTGFSDYEPIEKTILPHPILSDLALATIRVRNPFMKLIPKARMIVLETGKNLTFATRILHAKPGEPIGLTLKNPDVVPHNWALLKPGTLRRVGEMANQLVADPESVARHYIPQTDDVLFYTDVVPAKSHFLIYFHAPRKPGRYPYLCTFPGHWMVMNGELVVE